MSRQLPSAALTELQSLAQERGTITPHTVLDRAREETSALHSLFTWDDGEAAEQFRLIQASQVIRRARVVIIPREGAPEVNVRAFVSLENERASGVGYRPIEQVLKSPELTNNLLATAISELAAFRKKYDSLAELTGVFVEIDRLIANNNAAGGTRDELQEAVKMALKFERDGLDRTTAAARAAGAFHLKREDVQEAVRSRLKRSA